MIRDKMNNSFSRKNFLISLHISTGLLYSVLITFMGPSLIVYFEYNSNPEQWLHTALFSSTTCRFYQLHSIFPMMF